MKALLPAAVCAAAIALGGCGDDVDTSQGKQVADVVRKFALADDAKACDYLAGQALEDNYGGQGYADAKRHCQAKGDTFQGAPVKITLVKVTSDTTARVNAENQAGRLYVISLSKPDDDWLIERIVPQRASG